MQHKQNNRRKIQPSKCRNQWLIHVLEKPDETPKDETRKFSHLREYLKGLSEAFLEPEVYFCCPSFRKSLQKCWMIYKELNSYYRKGKSIQEP